MRKVLLIVNLASITWAIACSINPQPLPPDMAGAPIADGGRGAGDGSSGFGSDGGQLGNGSGDAADARDKDAGPAPLVEGGADASTGRDASSDASGDAAEDAPADAPADAVEEG